MALSEWNEAMYGTNVAIDVVAVQKIRQEHNYVRYLLPHWANK